MINRKTMALAITIILLLLIVIAYSVMQFATPFVSIRDLNSVEGRIEVKGHVSNGTVQWDPINSQLKFVLSEDNYTVPVIFQGDRPNGFESGRTVVVIGEYNGSRINATEILIKCPSKYRENDNSR